MSSDKQMFQTDDRFLKWIPTKKLSNIWVKSQRPYRLAWAQEIANNLDPDEFGVLIVSLPNGVGIYHIVDGQHRHGAVRIAFGEDQKVPCLVINAEEPGKAAKVWLGLNNTKKAHPVDHFRLRVEANETPAPEILKLIQRLGFDIDYRTHFSAETQKVYMSGVTALTWIYTRHNADVLGLTLGLITRLWAKDPLSFESATLKAFGQFCGEHRGLYHHDRLVGKMTSRWGGWSQFKQEYKDKGGALDLPGWQAGYNRIVTHYNAGLPRKERLAI